PRFRLNICPNARPGSQVLRSLEQALLRREPTECQPYSPVRQQGRCFELQSVRKAAVRAQPRNAIAIGVVDVGKSASDDDEPVWLHEHSSNDRIRMQRGNEARVRKTIRLQTSDSLSRTASNALESAAYK